MKPLAAFIWNRCRQMSALLCFVVAHASAESVTNTPPLPFLHIRADEVTAPVSPMLYGLMTEEINYSYEGGIYGELIRNRTFKASPSEPLYWSAVGGAGLSLDPANPLNEALGVSLKLDARQAAAAAPAGIANAGYWGIPLRPHTRYHVSFYAKAGADFQGTLGLSLENTNGVVLAKAESRPLTAGWQKFEADLKTKNIEPSKANIFKITTTTPGTIWLQQVSLFPPTFHGRPNGNRPDLMQLLADLHPKFLRLPGGNYLEGDTLSERFNWERTIGDIAQRPGHRSPWNYWSTDGLGLLEYLEWCEDLDMEPVLAVFAGYTLRHDFVKPGPDLEPYVQSALNEIEYITGDSSTRWGAQRARDGHPVPFPLHYVEIGNEDWFDQSGSYDGRFTQFFKAIKARYPQLQIIATAGVKSSTPDLGDEHFYESEESMEAKAHLYDTRERVGKPKVFVGEWATRVGSPTPNMAGALGDAAWMCGLERNSDLVVMQCYAPLFVNVSDLKSKDRSMQWESDLIGYDALTSYGSPSYYAQAMFSARHGDTVLAVDEENIPTYEWRSPHGPRQVPSLFFNATRERASGTIYLKIVNPANVPMPVTFVITGVKSIKSKGVATVLRADKPEDTNSLKEPRKVVPVTGKITGLGPKFTRDFPAYSISVLELQTR